MARLASWCDAIHESSNSNSPESVQSVKITIQIDSSPLDVCMLGYALRYTYLLLLSCSHMRKRQPSERP